ncbi:MAG: HlyD family secretion protein [Alphaproteobacteria bacterium]|nr:HlyD family secretion protein [Alphaproteobacteria bacterium]
MSANRDTAPREQEKRAHESREQSNRESPPHESPPRESVPRESAQVFDLRAEQREAPAPPRETQNAPAGSNPPRSAAARRRFGRGLLRLTLMAGGIAAVLAACAIVWLRGGRYVTTDNAYVRAAKLMVSTDVSGIVARVEVRQGESVAQNSVLFRLDPRQFEIALASARAQLEQVKLNVEAARQYYARIQNDIAAAQAVVAQARAVFQRANTLAQRNAGSQAQFDQSRYALAAEENRLAALRSASQAALTRLGGDAAAPPEIHPQFIEAQARVAEAQRQLDRTIVRAPFAGVVTSVESL